MFSDAEPPEEAFNKSEGPMSKVYIDAEDVSAAIKALGNSEVGARLGAALKQGKVEVWADDLYAYMEGSVKRSKGRPTQEWSEARARLLGALEAYDNEEPS